jgi:GNAT superfamily N-acetyltransferase
MTNKNIFREAGVNDIDEFMKVRMAVKENPLNNPALVTRKDNEEYLTQRGKGWVCESDGKIVGFAIVSVVDNNIWALFVDPQYEAKGIGKELHGIMMNWYFNQTRKTVWLGTAPKTRAELFYTKRGWTAVGTVNKGEVKFEMTFEDWARIRNKNANKISL